MTAEPGLGAGMHACSGVVLQAAIKQGDAMWLFTGQCRAVRSQGGQCELAIVVQHADFMLAQLLWPRMRREQADACVCMCLPPLLYA